jgi:hypothetical protein
VLVIILLLLSVGLYAASFFLPTFGIVVDSQIEIHVGYEAFGAALVLTFNGLVPNGRAFVPWLANPVLWYGVYCCVKHKYIRAIIAGILCTAFAAVLWLESGHQDVILIGYYVWTGSMALFAGAAIALAYFRHREARLVPEDRDDAYGHPAGLSRAGKEK